MKQLAGTGMALMVALLLMCTFAAGEGTQSGNDAYMNTGGTGDNAVVTVTAREDSPGQGMAGTAGTSGNGFDPPARTAGEELADVQVLKTTRVSVLPGGFQGDGDSVYPSASGNGRFVAFHSWATNLVSTDTNGMWDIFVQDRETRRITMVSVKSDGTQGDGYSWDPSISADGRYVAFRSGAATLVNGDANGQWDVFVHDRQTRRTSLVSVKSNGAQGDMASGVPSISGNGRYVAFDSAATNLVNGDLNGKWDVFVHDRQTGKTRRVSVRSNGNEGNEDSMNPSISANGRYVAFESLASNLVSGDLNGQWDVFVHDRQTGRTTRVSVRSNGHEVADGSGSASISADGRYVAFMSDAVNLVNDDTNGGTDVFVHDRQTGRTTRASVRSNGREANPGSMYPSISANGRYVAFQSGANDLVAGDTNSRTDAFVHDRQTGRTTRVSVRSNGNEATDTTYAPAISANGRYVAYYSYATDLVNGDTNGFQDVFATKISA